MSFVIKSFVQPKLDREKKFAKPLKSWLTKKINRTQVPTTVQV